MLFASGCGLLGPNDEKAELQLVVDSGFNRDWVVVEVAGRVVIADTLTSDEYSVPEVCCYHTAAVDVRLPQKQQVLVVRINESQEEAYAFDPSRWKAIVIRYDRSEQRVSFVPGKALPPVEG